MVVKIMFNNENPCYFRFVECDTLHVEKDVGSLKLLMCKHGKLVDSTELHCSDPISSHVLLMEGETVVEEFRLIPDVKLEEKVNLDRAN